MVVIDAHSKWPEVFVMEGTTAKETFSTLHSLFARLGLPDQIVSDNGPQFTSEAFRKFTTANGIKHVTGAPYFHLIETRHEPFYYILSDGAGVGKSHLIKAMYQATLKYLHNSWRWFPYS